MPKTIMITGAGSGIAEAAAIGMKKAVQRHRHGAVLAPRHAAA